MYFLSIVTLLQAGEQEAICDDKILHYIRGSVVESFMPQYQCLPIGGDRIKQPNRV